MSGIGFMLRYRTCWAYFLFVVMANDIHIVVAVSAIAGSCFNVIETSDCSWQRFLSGFRASVGLVDLDVDWDSRSGSRQVKMVPRKRGN
jgi:hypothetical protein